MLLYSLSLSLSSAIDTPSHYRYFSLPGIRFSGFYGNDILIYAYFIVWYAKKFMGIKNEKKKKTKKVIIEQYVYILT